MKTNGRRGIVLVLVMIMCCGLLCACGISEEDAIGVWSSTYVYDGNEFSSVFILEANGEYSKETNKNGSLSSTEEGIWEIDDGKVVLYEDGNRGIRTEYQYKNGKLVNNGHKFTKE